jgi:UDP-N-acetylmuramoyl-tripeptide--D-alanyl-D-alanine ligase
LTHGRLASGIMPENAGAICSDTRILEEGEWFIALNGRKFDGHDFVGDAFAGGAIGCIVEERPSYAIANQTFPLIAVSDVYSAYHSLARNWRKRISSKLVLITGEERQVVDLIRSLERAIDERGQYVQSFYESGKEGDALDFCLSVSANTDAVLFGLLPEEFAAIERISRTVQPNIVVMLKGSLENFRLEQIVEEVEKAKRSLFSSMSRNAGTLLLVDTDDRLMSELQEVKTIDVRGFPAGGRSEGKTTEILDALGQPGAFAPDAAQWSQPPELADPEVMWSFQQVLQCLDATQ